jgi:alkylated DNA repair dioxygenase AlkB
MDNQLENTGLNETIVENQVADVVIQKDLPYISVQEMFNTPEYDAYIDSADVAEMQQLDQIRPLVDKYGIGAFGNMGLGRPTLATETFDPVLQQNPPTLDEPNGFNRKMEAAIGKVINKQPEPGTAIASPIYTGIRQSNFQRYYNHPEFSNLGFTPYSDMESYYNANSTVYDDMSRTIGEFGSLVGTGFMSGYRSIGSMLEGDFSGPDLQSATEFEDVMAIGNSSRGGGLAWTNNFLLNSGYTFGIIGSIAIEEVVLAGASALSGGYLAPVAVVKSALNVGRIGKTIANTFGIGRLASATRGMMNTVRNVDAAKDFYGAVKSGGTFVGKIFAPETVRAIRSIKTAENGAQNLSNLAKTAKTFGGFYRDTRSLNLAMAESKLEGGMVYNQMVRDGMNIKLKDNYGGAVTTTQMEDVQDKASRSAFATTMGNAPLIFLTNQLVLGNAFGGFNRSFARLVNDKVTGVGRRIIQKTKSIGKDGKKVLAKFDEDGNLIEGVFEDVGTGLRAALKAIGKAGIKGNALKAAAKSLRYFSGNFGEGIQEISQEAISEGTRGYYTSLLKDPMSGGQDLWNQQVSSAISSQFSAQGFDVFMSGFLMGGVVSGPQKLFFQGVPAIYQRISDPEAFKEYKKNREDYVKAVVNTYNTAWNAQAEDPNAIFDLKKLNFLIQKQVAGEMKQSAFDGDQFGFIDAKDLGKFQQIYTLLSTGGAYYFKDQLLDYMQLSDEELGEAFESDKKDIKSGKLRARLQDMVNQIDQTEDIYNETKDKFSNPFDESQFKKGTRQHQEEAIKRLSFDHARYLYMFTNDGFNRSVERANSIYEKLAADPLFTNMAANDITVLLDVDAIENEIRLLTGEIAILEKDKSQKAQVKEKDKRKKRLESFKDVLLDPANLTKDGSFDRRKIGRLKKPFYDYVRFMAKASGSFVNENAVNEALKQIVDYNALKGRAKVYDKAIEYLNNPERFTEIVERTNVFLKEVYKNIQSKFKDSVEQYISVKEQNELLNQLSALGVTPNPSQIKLFAETGDARFLQIFHNENGELRLYRKTNEYLSQFDKELLADIKKLIDVYTKATQPEQTEVDVATEEAQTEETRKDIADLLGEDLTGIELPAGESKVLNSILEKAYRKHSATQTYLGETPLKYEAWINSQEGQAYREAFNAIKKIWIGNDLVVNVNRPLSAEQIKNDQNLISWLRSQEGRTNDLVAEVLDKLGLPLSDISGQVEEMPEEGESVQGNKNQTLIKKGASFSLLENTTIDNDGNKTLVWQIVDSKTGKALESDVLVSLGLGEFPVFLDKTEAIRGWRKAELETPNEGLFVFDGVEGLHYGAKVYKNGIEYTVVSTPKTIVNKTILSLIPSDAIGLSRQERIDQKVFINLREGEFKGFYELQKLDFKILSKNVSRLDYTEPVTPYGARNVDDGENWADAQTRYYAILSILTQDDINSLEFVVTIDPDGGTLGSQYIIPGKEANPYIQRARSKYIIGIKSSNPIVQGKINGLLEGRGLQPNKNADGVFAYMPNESYVMTDVNGNQIDPTIMTREQALNLISIPDALKNKLSKEEALALVQNNWAKNALLVSELDALMGLYPPGSPVTIQQNQLSKALSFNSILGNVVYDNSSARKLEDLDHSAADELGNYLIFQLENSKTGRTVVQISNLEGDERRALINRVTEALTSQGIIDELTSGTDAYKAAVLLPDGTYRLVSLKSEILAVNNLDPIFVDLIERAQLTQAKNKDGKNPTYNDAFNDDIKSKLFISAYPGLGISLGVDKYGNVQLSIVKDGEWTDFKLTKKELNDTELSVSDKIDLLIAQANKSEVLTTAVSSPEAGSKVGFTLSQGNFRASYSRVVSIAELLEKTTTNAVQEVVGISKIELSADSADIQAQRNVSQINTNSTTPVEETADQGLPVEDTVEDLEQEEYDAYKADEFANLPKLIFEQIATKLSLGQELTSREIEIRSARLSEIEFRLSLKGGAPVETVENLSALDKLKKERDDLQAKLIEGKKGAAKRKAIKNSKELQSIIKKIQQLGNEANKIVPALTTQDVENIDAFMGWAANNLPDFISIEDITTLGNNMKAGGVRVGAFALNLSGLAGGLDISGTLYTGANSPFRYHEAFHGIFRMLLTDEEIKKYLAIAKKEVRAKLRAEGKNFEQELQKFRNSADTYSSMSKERLEQEYYEEYMADKFEEFKQNPKQTKTDPAIKSLFTRILEWIKSVFNSYSKNELLTLFENIDAGKYQTASVASNQFTSTLTTGVTLEANALVPYEKVEDGSNQGYLFLDSAIADPLIRSIAAMYLSRASKITDPNTNRADVLEEVIDDFYNLYDPENETNNNKTDIQKRLLGNVISAFNYYEDGIKSQVYNILNVIDNQIAEEEYNTEYFEDTIGLRGADQWNVDASLVGGLNSTPKQIRSYIATTTKSETDFFGNTELVEGEPLIVPVNYTEVYNGLLKSVKNISDPRKMLQTMYFFGQDNAETGAVVTRILQDIGITEETLLQDSSLPLQLKNPQLFQSIIKAFENFRVDYLFSQRDAVGNVIMYSAAQRDDINSQIDRWSQAWNNAYKKIKTNPATSRQVEQVLSDFSSYLNVTDTRITDVRLSDISREYSEKIYELTGIRLSRQYIAFSIASNRANKTKKQNALMNVHSDESPILFEDILTMTTLIQQGNNIFSDGESGMSSRLREMAINNAPFDETIGLSVFKNSEGNLVYAHQKPTYHLKRIEALNDLAELERIKKENPYLKNNYLLNSEAFMQLSNENRQRVLRIAGTAIGELNSTEEQINENISGVSSRSTYGNFTPQEFALNLINSYTALVNTKSDKVDYVEFTDPITNEKVKVALSPSLIRVLEASNTGDLMYMPVTRTVEFAEGSLGDIVLTDETVDVFITSIETEFERIKRESNVDTKTNEEIIGYNAIGVDDEGKPLVMRAYELHNSALLLTPARKTQLEEIAKRSNSVSLEAAMIELNMTMDEFKSEVRNKLESQFTEFKAELETLNIKDEISIKIREGLISGGVKSNPALEASAYLLNLTYDEEYNLKQIFFNDWINTQAINEILLGDQAVTLKNGVDAIKRAKAQNAATISAYSAITAPELGVNHTVEDISLVTLEEPIGTSALTDNSIERADAQMWMTTKAFRYMYFGFGKLTPMQADLLNKIEAGEDITSDEIFNQDGYIKEGVMLNSKKLVYFDGATFIKMSAFVLTPQLTSNKVVAEDGTITWEPKENAKELHDLRVKLEGIESLPGKNTLGIAAPLSALKMLKQKVKTLEEVSEQKIFGESDYTTLSAKNMGLQLENPSNKLEIVDPTQIKALVTSEQKDSIFVPALNMTVGQIRKAYNLATSTRVELKYKNKRNLIFTFDSAMNELAISKDQGKLTPNLMAFLRYAQEGLKASQASSNLLEYFSTIDGEQKYDLNNPITINKFEQLFLSYLSKGSLAEKQPGHSLALVSDYGMNVYRRVYSINKEGIPDRSEIIRENQWNKLSNKPEIVEFDNLLGREIPKEGVVIIDRLRSNVKEYDSKGNFTGERYTEMLMPAHFQSVMDLVENGTMSMPEVISKMFGIRIPSQDNHSTVNIKLVDFLPVFYGSSAMFAQELIEISGADFDIDKIYAQIKEFYTYEGKFYEYGKGQNNKARYDDYLNYVNKKVTQTGSIYNEAYQLYNQDSQSARIQNSVTDAELNIASDAGFSEESIKALQMLGLPITKKQYIEYRKKYREPYEAPANNAILDYKYALMGNTGVTEDKVGNELPISYQSASLDILKDELKYLVSISRLFELKNQEDNIDINNLLGKVKAFTSNKGAAIGAIVSPNVNLSLLTEYGVIIKKDGPVIKINGVTYNDFGVLREIKTITYTPKGKATKTYIIKDNKIFNTSDIEVFKTDSVDRSAILMMADGAIRKQDIISSLITMATDNAKERLVAKLGLNRSALGLVANLTSLGVPIRTSLLLINIPFVQDIYTEALNKKEKTDPGVRTLIDNEMLILNPDESITLSNINNDLLLKAIDKSDEITNVEKYTILNLLAEGVKIQEFTGKMRSVSNLTTGLGQNIASVNKKKGDINALLDETAMMDLSSIYESDTWQSKYVEIFKQITNEILPVTFLSASNNFQTILNKTLGNIDQNNKEFNDEALAKVSRDLLSYITIKAYQHNKLNNNSQSIANLNNKFLYPASSDEVNNSIIKVINNLRERVDMKDNYFLESFVNVLNSEDASNQSGLNLANANTFLSLNQLQQVDLQTAFAQIYGTAETKDDALSIINYIMVKDGLQMSYNTLLSAISPFTMEAYLVQIETANQSLRGYNPLDKTSDEKMMATFGLTFQELQNEFIDGYALSNINNSLLKTYTVSKISKLPEGIVLNRENKTLTAPTETPRFFRIGYDNFDGNTVYVTYKRESNQVGEDVPFSEDTRELYVEVDTMGSNQQNAIGFMFGERPTYKEVRQYVKNKNIMSDESDTVNPESTPTTTTQKEQVLSDQNANVEAKNGEVLIDGINIADINQEDIEVVGIEENAVSAAGLLGLLGAQSAQQTSGVELDIASLLTNGLVSTKGLQRVNVEGAEVFTKQVFTSEESKKVFKFIEELYTETYYAEHVSSDKFGRGRRSMYFSDESYSYSGTTRPANVGKEEFQRLISKITTELGFEEGYFDMILINEYKDGSQKIGFHTDNEPILNNKGKLNPSVVTISFGDERTMILKGKNQYSIPMKSGLGLIMGKDGQINYKHGIAPEANKSKRFSITLRHNASKSQNVNKTKSTQQTSEVDIFLKKESLAKAPAFAQKAIAKTVEAIPEDVRLKVIKKAYEGVTATFIANSLNLTTKQVRSIRTYYGAPAIADKKEYKKWKDGITAELAEIKQPTQTSEVESELSEAEESVTPLEGQLLLDLTFALDNQYTTLTNFWDDKIQGDPEFKAKLRAQKILSLEDMVDAYKDGIYTSEEEFIESLGCL